MCTLLRPGTKTIPRSVKKEILPSFADPVRNRLLYLFLLIVPCLRAQDPHFSQYNEQPALINPALTGAVTNIRASVNYKEQWRSISRPFKTMGASFEVRSIGNRKRVGRFGTSGARRPGRFAAGVS